MRLIVVLRNPIERAYSHWAMEHARGAEVLSFEQAIDNEQERCREALPLQHRVFSYIDRGFYSFQLRRLWRFFGREAVLVLRHEELREKPNKCLMKIWKHLNIKAPKQAITPRERHNGVYDAPMSKTAHHKLRQVFWHEIGQLEALLGWDCNNWLQNKETKSTISNPMYLRLKRDQFIPLKQKQSEFQTRSTNNDRQPESPSKATLDSCLLGKREECY